MRRAEEAFVPPLAAEHPDVPLARLFAMAYRHLVVGLHERLAARGWQDVRPSYGYVLLACRDRPTTSGELASLLGVSKQAASKTVDGMVDAGLVRRGAAPEDSRAKLVALTARGRRLLATVEEIYVELESEMADVVGRRTVEAVRSGLVELLSAAYDGELPVVRPV
ncbi:MAG: MarR family winged helix-turn-helix transcriptional regulator [Actinomycetes bacterium]